MISQDDIDGFTPDEVAAVEVLDRVAQDMKRGVPQFMEASAKEFPLVVRAGLLWKEVAIDLLRQRQEAARNAMGVFDRTGKEAG
jgi:hypothetical protein